MTTIKNLNTGVKTKTAPTTESEMVKKYMEIHLALANKGYENVGICGVQETDNIDMLKVTFDNYYKGQDNQEWYSFIKDEYINIK